MNIRIGISKKFTNRFVYYQHKELTSAKRRRTMRVIIKPDYEQVTDWAATYIAYRINRARPTPAKPFVLGLPMGDTPKGMYKKLVELNRAGK